MSINTNYPVSTNCLCSFKGGKMPTPKQQAQIVDKLGFEIPKKIQDAQRPIAEQIETVVRNTIGKIAENFKK